MLDVQTRRRCNDNHIDVVIGQHPLEIQPVTAAVGLRHCFAYGPVTAGNAGQTERWIGGDCRQQVALRVVSDPPNGNPRTFLLFHRSCQNAPLWEMRGIARSGLPRKDCDIEPERKLSPVPLCGNPTVVANNPWDRVTVVLVTYNSEQVIEGVVASLADAPNVILVDNASDDETVAIAKRIRPAIECIVNATNRGLGAAVNQGFARAATDLGLLLNPDARISTNGVAALVSAADANEKAGIVAPLLENSAGRLELSLMGPFEHTHHPVQTVPEGPFCTWFTTGAVWLAKMDAWSQIGGFDEAIFLYNDDADLCLRLCSAGFHLLVVPEIRAPTRAECRFRTRPTCVGSRTGTRHGAICSCCTATTAR